MRIKNIKVRFFRMLANASINLEDDITLVVGRNNTGKTSLLEIIKMLTSNDDALSFEDFSQSSYSLFKELNTEFEKTLEQDISEEDKEAMETDIQERFPKIQLQIEFIYDRKKDSLVELSEFITDLDVERNDACVLLSYEPTNTLGLLKQFHNRIDKDISLIPYLRENLNTFYKLKCYAKDIKSNYKREIALGFKEKIKKIVSFEDIKALRILDDKKNDKNKTLALGFSRYYNERDKTDSNVQAVEEKLKEVSTELKDKYDAVLVKILDDLKRFGAETPVVIPPIVIDSEFDSEAVIRNNIKYYYKQDEINLPESYNGLGYSNLVYMILELSSFIQRFANAKEEKVSEFLTVLLEEPEAHMHPQMQQVFISQIKGIIEDAKEDDIHVQLLITSHSSHILSEAGIDSEKGFKRIRYFNRTENSIEVQDFNTLKISNEEKTARFLKQYLTLHKSDLFFSDKVIIVEGTTERMLMPQLILKSAPGLVTQYVSILEVGGAYTHKFKEILEFLKLKTLVVTDIDSIDAHEKKKCPVNAGANGELTSNYTLKDWIPKKSLISELLECNDENKIENNIIRVAYQIEENSIVGRSFEEAFIITNFDLIKSKYTDKNGEEKDVKNLFSFSRVKSIEDLNAESPFDLAPSTSSSKTNFAFDVMSFPENEEKKWKVPAYIDEGLKWLEKPLELKFEEKIFEVYQEEK
jgi:predicted ATP-dependent endonuclease of OLD family